MKVHKIICLFLTLFFLTVFVSAEDLTQRQAELFGVDTMENSLRGESAALMEEFSPREQTDFLQGALSIFKSAAAESTGKLKSAIVTMLRVLLIVVLCAVVDTFTEEKGKNVACMTGVLAITACCASGIHAMVGLGKATMDEISSFSTLLLPVMVSAATASGSMTGAGITYTLATAFSNLLIRFCNFVLLPGVYAYLALAITDCILQKDQLKRMRELLGWFIEKGLKTVVYVFTGILTVSGMLAGSTDAAALKAAKSALTGMVPVVGSIISGATDAVFSGAVFLKNAVGTFGMLAVLSIFIIPFFQMGISYIIFKVTSALSGIFESRHTVLLDSISSVMGYLLAMTASCALITMLSCCSFIRTVYA